MYIFCFLYYIYTILIILIFFNGCGGIVLLNNNNNNNNNTIQYNKIKFKVLKITSFKKIFLKLLDGEF